PLGALLGLVARGVLDLLGLARPGRARLVEHLLDELAVGLLGAHPRGALERLALRLAEAFELCLALVEQARRLGLARDEPPLALAEALLAAGELDLALRDQRVHLRGQRLALADALLAGRQVRLAALPVGHEARGLLARLLHDALGLGARLALELRADLGL